MECEGITNIIIINSEGEMDVCTKFHAHLSNSCQDISQKPYGSLQKSYGIAKVSSIHPLGTMNISH